MPRGDKSKYTDKQERKADHIAEGYEKRGFQSRRPSAGRGQPSTKMTAAARRLAGPAVASLPAIRPPIKVARKAVQPQRPARQRAALRLRRRQRPHASGTSKTPDRPLVL